MNQFRVVVLGNVRTLWMRDANGFSVLIKELK